MLIEIDCIDDMCQIFISFTQVTNSVPKSYEEY